jgi:hypothetical protein
MPRTSIWIGSWATLQSPGGKDKGADWTFLGLPQEESKRLPARDGLGRGTLNGASVAATLEPDGQGGHGP